MSKHSKAPFTTSFDKLLEVFSDDGVAIAQVYRLRSEDFEANARLIAAAPELLEALQELFEQCAMVHKHWGDGSNQKESDSAIAAGLAAIRKATS